MLQSLWHGPDKDGKLEVRVLTPSSGAGVSRGAGSLPKAGERRRVFAIRVEGNAASAVAEFETFANKTGTMSESAFPLLRHILGAPAEPGISREVQLSCVQIYMEVVHDLINPDANVELREDPNEGFVLSGHTTEPVASVELESSQACWRLASR